MRPRLDFPRFALRVDYAARLQRPLSASHQLTGNPILINASLNISFSGQPIVRTTADAWGCFQRTDIDYLVIDDCLYRNPLHYSTAGKLKRLQQLEWAA